MKELIEEIDEKGNPVKTISRQEAHEKGLMHRTVVLMLFDLDGRLFLQKRAGWKKYFGGKWEFSAGGHLEAGEGEEKGMKKEAEEEIGVKELNLKKIGEERVDVKQEGMHNKEIVSVFKTVSKTGIVIDGEEVEDGRFWELEELKKEIEENEAEFTPLLVRCLKKYF